MLICSEKYGVRGGAAKAASMSAPGVRLRPRPPCFLAGFCFLSAPEGRLGVCAWALRGFERDHQTLQRPLNRRTTQKEFSK